MVTQSFFRLEEIMSNSIWMWILNTPNNKIWTFHFWQMMLFPYFSKKFPPPLLFPPVFKWRILYDWYWWVTNRFMPNFPYQQYIPFQTIEFLILDHWFSGPSSLAAVAVSVSVNCCCKINQIRLIRCPCHPFP